MAQRPVKKIVRPAPAAANRRLNLRTRLFPDLREEDLWSRTRFIGFTSIPRTLSIIVRIIDNLDEKSSGKVYLDLWCRAFDDYFIDVRDEYEFAYSSGYSGQRAVRTWRERVRVLKENGFIRFTKTPDGRVRHIVLLDPHPVIDQLISEGLLSEEETFAFESHLLAIGAR